MRIVAGTARGRQVEAPPGRTTRPTSDRVREAVFSVLGSMGGVEDLSVADLFAGSGALGLEALSQGAARAVFVESDRRAADVVETNLTTLGLGGPSVVVRRGEVAGHLAEAAGADLIFADPPYAFDGWADLGEGLVAAGFDGVLVAEAGAEVNLGGGWHVLRVKRYGGTVVTVAQPEDPDRPRSRMR